VLLESQVSPRMHADLCGKFHLCWGFTNHSGHLPEEFSLTIATLSRFCKLTILTIFLARSQHSDQSGHLVSHEFILSMLAIPCAVHACTEQVRSQSHFAFVNLCKLLSRPLALPDFWWLWIEEVGCQARG
jgi:hypothetical protein